MVCAALQQLTLILTQFVGVCHQYWLHKSAENSSEKKLLTCAELAWETRCFNFLSAWKRSGDSRLCISDRAANRKCRQMVQRGFEGVSARLSHSCSDVGVCMNNANTMSHHTTPCEHTVHRQIRSRRRLKAVWLEVIWINVSTKWQPLRKLCCVSSVKVTRVLEEARCAPLARLQFGSRPCWMFADLDGFKCLILNLRGWNKSKTHKSERNVQSHKITFTLRGCCSLKEQFTQKWQSSHYRLTQRWEVTNT